MKRWKNVLSKPKVVGWKHERKISKLSNDWNSLKMRFVRLVPLNVVGYSPRFTQIILSNAGNSLIKIYNFIRGALQVLLWTPLWYKLFIYEPEYLSFICWPWPRQTWKALMRKIARNARNKTNKENSSLWKPYKKVNKSMVWIILCYDHRDLFTAKRNG